MMSLLTALVFGTLVSYPTDWWKEIPRSERAEWETLLPQDLHPPKVVISKRTELGAFSNFEAASFKLDGKIYASVEGFWQMMKYPDPEDQTDPRRFYKKWPRTREEVAKLSGWEAKYAGDQANQIMKDLGIHWISYLGQRFEPKDKKNGSQLHHQLIFKATRAKILQNPRLSELLKKTSGLQFQMDHLVEPGAPAAYQTPKILMEIRDELLGKTLISKTDGDRRSP